MLINWIIHRENLRDEIWSEEGLSNDVLGILLFNIIVPPMAMYLNFLHLIRWFKRTYIKLYGNKCHFTQKEANFWFEGPPFDISQG